MSSDEQPSQVVNTLSTNEENQVCMCYISTDQEPTGIATYFRGRRFVVTHEMAAETLLRERTLWLLFINCDIKSKIRPVSYTHLTLPTNREV